MPRGKMNPAEKLMAMAIGAIEVGQSQTDFFGRVDARAQAQIAGITLYDVWFMACYVYVFRKPVWEQEAIRKDRAWDPIPPAPVGFI